MGPPDPRTPRQLILGNQGSIYLHLGTIAKKLGLEKCAKLLKGFQLAITPKALSQVPSYHAI
jgi:hypothetical protein